MAGTQHCLAGQTLLGQGVCHENYPDTITLKVFQTSGAEPILAEVAFNNGKADMDIFWTSRQHGQQGNNGSEAEKATVCDTDGTKARGVKQCDVIDWSLYYWNVGSLIL